MLKWSSLLRNFDDLKTWLANHLRRQVNVVFKPNPLYIAHLRRDERSIELSLHSLFLAAPPEILRALADFALGRTTASSHLRHFAFKRSQLAIKRPIFASDKGLHHDLHSLYLAMRERYFPESKPCQVTWFARSGRLPKRSITLGVFDACRRSIKVHRLLDQPSVPQLFVQFVLYHESLHDLCPPFIDERHRLRVHTAHFKLAERRFEGYAECLKWRKEQLWKIVRASPTRQMEIRSGELGRSRREDFLSHLTL